MSTQRKQSNFSLYLRQKLAAGANAYDGVSDNMDLNFDDESAIAYSQLHKPSFTGLSESEVAEGEGGARDYDLDDLAELLGVENMEQLTSIMHGDSNRDQEAQMAALEEAIAEASQGGQNFRFAQRGHAPSGFELDSNFDDLKAIMYEQRSSVAGHNEGDSDDEYVNKSEYELDFDLEDINRMKE